MFRMDTDNPSGRETAVLAGGPADGLRIAVTGRPRALQVTYPCTLEDPESGVRVEAVHTYRRDWNVRSEPLRYGFDGVTP